MAKAKDTQGLLFDLPSDQPYPSLILSIRPVFVDKIFQGTKLFELRKTLPISKFQRVYLYESGTGKGIVGCFDVKRTYTEPLDKLWEIVGELGTTKERFDAYFAGYEQGSAIGIANPVKFRQSVLVPMLRRKMPTFSAPMSYLVLQPSEPLYGYLEAKRMEEIGHRRIELRMLHDAEFEGFRELVTEEISKNYDEITEKFADSILRSHKLGHDPNGIFTIRKEVYSIVAEPNFVIGYTVITYKIGGSAKTGPTIIFEEYRNKGYGTSTRTTIEDLCRSKKVRKLYCTCPDVQSGVIRYLLKHGMRVEAHLVDHYSSTHGDLVFGKLLTPSLSTCLVPPRPLDSEGEVTSPSEFDEDQLTPVVERLLVESGYDVDSERAGNIVRAASSSAGKSYEDKPLMMVCLRHRARCIGFSVLVPKRGGSVKAILATESTNVEGVSKLVEESERVIRLANKRKFYVNHALCDSIVIESLMGLGFQAEGVLRQPYREGIDHLILSKRL